ncbi:MAG: multidrug efflux SMR transporter [Eubacterium sp.]|nr:multidrug efflux SMR transporter [Eubacterium sp.]
MRWIYLLIAGACEIMWAMTMKMSDGFTVVLYSVLTVVGYVASAVFLALALKQLPLGVAYAMWTGMGIVGTTLLGVFVFEEKLSAPQAICVILIMIGIAGLKILGKE